MRKNPFVKTLEKFTFKFSMLLPFIFLSCSGKSPKAVEGASPSALNSSVNREIATEEAADEEAQFEQRFQEILISGNVERGMIYHLDRLYHLAIETNRHIEKFEKDLDEKLVRQKDDPKAEIESPLESVTYKRLLKLWALSEKYQDEINYFFLRSLQIRTDKSLPQEQRVRAGEIKKKVVAHLKKANLSQRVELQDLAERLQETFESFIENYKKQTAESQNKEQSSKNAKEESLALNERPFKKFLFSNPQELQKIYDTNQVENVPQFQGMALEKQRVFMENIERDLAKIPEPTTPREPDSVPNLSCGGTKRLCISTGENGNIMGTIFPRGVWAFTYDDGPAARSTSDMMELLHNYKDRVNPVGKATFFWLAKNVVSYPQWVKKGLSYGFPLENHSYSHANLAKLGPNGLRHEIVESNRVLESEFRKVDPNYVIQYFRCPYGACYAPKVSAVREMLVAQKQIHVYWRIDSLDWKLRNGTRVANLVTKQMQLMDHGVILMHDIHPPTVEATRQILAWLKDQNDNRGANFKMVTIPEAVDLVNGH